MSNLLARILVALVAIPILIVLLYKVPPVGFYILVVLSCVLAAIELFGLVTHNDRRAQAIGATMTCATSVAFYFRSQDVKTVITIFIVIPLVGLLIPLARLGQIPTAALRVATFAFGPVYCAIPATLIALLQRDFHPGFSILALALAWAGDTGAYFAGKYLGGAKLYEEVSPKKTIAGSIGGLFGSLLSGIVVSLWVLPSHLLVLHAVPLSIVGGALGQAGDLAESLLKRSIGVKDSGHILPGHGGILDRIDALMFTSTTVYLYVLWR